MKNWKDVRKQLLSDPTVRLEYEKLEPEYRIARSLLQARLSQGLTQAELAKKTGLKQAMIARLESGTTNPTIGTVSKIADALGKELQLV